MPLRSSSPLSFPPSPSLRTRQYHLHQARLWTSHVDFSQGSVTFTVTAQDGVTTRAYFAKAVTDTTDNPDITYPIDEQLAGEYKGLLNITLGGEPVGSDIARNITVAKVDDETVSLTISLDFNGTPVEVTFNGTKLTGSESSEAIITSFTFDASYPAKTYKLAVIFAASKEGNQYRAASGSIMVVDSVTIICE